MIEKKEARQACIVAYARRYAGSPEIKITYTGRFPYQELADAMDLATTAEGSQHERCWNLLYREFDRSWGIYEQNMKRVAA